MFSKRWTLSQRQYGVIHEKNVAIPVSAGFTIDADIFRPDAPGRFPVILGFFPFSKENMVRPTWPEAISPTNVSNESGDYNFYVKRGYVHVLANVRGTGKSGGLFDHLGKGTIQDIYDVIQWLGKQPWSDGQVATFGTSYFAMTAKKVAELKPPYLRTIFAPFGVTDQYRHAIYQGGIFSYQFHQYWLKSLDNLRIAKYYRQKIGEEAFQKQIKQALDDPEINVHPELVECLTHPDESGNMLIVEYLLNYLDTEYYKEKAVHFNTDVKIPAYFGGCWGMYSLHLPGDFISFQRWKGPKKLTIGPPYYLDRPVYQYQNESLRWFDYWLKGIPTEIMDEPEVSLYIMNSGEWKQCLEWPLFETKWTEFYLHKRGILSEHEMMPDDDFSRFEDRPGARGSLTFLTPRMVEDTEICGPLVLNLYASTTDTEVLWFISFFEVDENGKEKKALTRGWLRGSQRRVDPVRSTPWQPYHPHNKREPLKPGEIYEFNIDIVPTGVLIKAGCRFGIRIKCADDDEKPADFLEQHAIGHLSRPNRSEITVYHNDKYPSHLLVPITRGNKIGTFMSGGIMPPL